MSHIHKTEPGNQGEGEFSEVTERYFVSIEKCFHLMGRKELRKTTNILPSGGIKGAIKLHGHFVTNNHPISYICSSTHRVLHVSTGPVALASSPYFCLGTRT